MNTDFERVRQIFLAIVEQPSAQWEALLDEACGDDANLRQQVALLLKAHAEGDGILDRNEAGTTPTGTGESTSERPGMSIGPYKLLQQIGEGGMGVVWMAEQTEPVKRKVALKVIKPGMDSRQVIARFEAERQALAMMDHVNIARVFDGGATESGRPYFVMELVHGVPITRYCDDNHLSPRERLELFVPVCQAIQHAHQKGIIHRDIKPSNVMVTLYDPGAPGVPKVIDFGVAKATEQKLTERTLFTQYGTMMGTLEYMSPEQAEMSPENLGIDTRSDIYSLGVLLYELLTGSTPLTRQRMQEAAYAEILRLIKEEEPPRPSTRLSDSGEKLASISALRKTEPAKLTKLVKGELDWIVMKALEKDRNRRYETANGFAMDVQRYLADEPVLACPPSAGYRLRKFARKHRRLLATAAAFVALLVAAAAGSIALAAWALGAEQTTREEQERTQTALERESDARKTTQKALERESDARKTTQVALERETDARRTTRKTLARISDRVVEATFTRKTQVTEEDKSFLREILSDYEKFAAEAGDSATARDLRTDGYLRVGVLRTKLGELQKAEDAFHAALENQTRLVDEFPAVPDYRRRLATCHTNMGHLLNSTGRPKEAEAADRRAVQLWERLTAESPARGDYRRELSVAYTNLGALLAKTGRPEKAEKVNAQALELLEKLVAEFPTVPEYLQALAQNRQNVGDDLSIAGRFQEAEPILHRAVELNEKLVTQFPSAPDYRRGLAECRMNLSSFFLSTKRPEKAEEQMRLALIVCEGMAADFPAVPDFRFRLAGNHYNLAILLTQAKRFPEAEAAYRRARQLLENLVAGFPNVTDYRSLLGATLNNLVSFHLLRDELAEARRLAEQAIEHQRVAVKSSPQEVVYRQYLANHYRTLTLTLVRLGEHEEAVTAAAEAPRLYPASAEECRRAAQFVARSVPLARKDNKLQEVERQALAEKYTGQAVAFLRDAVKRGYKNAKELMSDKHLAPVREHKEFKKLIAELEAKGS